VSFYVVDLPLFVTAPSLSNVTDEQYFLQQDGVQESSGNPTNPGGETTHARKEVTPGKFTAITCQSAIRQFSFGVTIH
jgi:hypothetical protein